MALNIPALVSIVFFYIITLAIGVWAARRTKRIQTNGNHTEVAIVGGRSINLFVGLFTMTATWVGGGFINGSAEITYLPGGGLVWLQVPLGYAIGLVLGALFFVTPMRSKKYLTMMDPLQESYGNTMASLLFIPALIGDTFWFAAILSSLASAVTIIMDIQNYLSIIASACIVITYTLFGGLYSVAYTDVIQLLFMIFGLCLCLPFAMMNPTSLSIVSTATQEVFQTPWLGRLDLQYIGVWIDSILYISLGSIPWQIYFQRILSASTTSQAKITSLLSSITCMTLAVPSVLVGAVAASTDWNQTSYGLPTPYERGEAGMILPIVFHYLCPSYVSVAGLGAVAAAVMSSADSCLLSSSSMFGYNIYKKIIRKQASEKEVMVVMRISTVILGSLGASFAFLSNSVYDLWFMCGELVYALVFPQLFCVLFIRKTNTYGSAAAFFLGLVLRVLGGVESLRLPPVIHYPWCTLIDGNYVQLFPFKTFTMLVTLFILVVVSYTTDILFKNSYLPIHWDICHITKANDIIQETKTEVELLQVRNTENCHLHGAEM
ncbi:high-affinity choline transporter 1-like [Pelobates fuscus]|uniref:high-affinity choline transporter 1-like n=1 Tax=Pelobates fuscus TaxID=191477 RepID=UPI002FE48D00